MAELQKIPYRKLREELIATGKFERETSEKGRFKLVADMTESGENFERHFEDNLRFIEILKRGILEKL